MTQAEARDAELADRLRSILDTGAAEGLAVRATFDPRRCVPPDDREAVRVVSDEVTGSQGRAEWILKERVRTRLLAQILKRGPGALQVVRQAQKDIIPTALQTVLDLFIEGLPLDAEQRSEAELVGALHVIRWALTTSSLVSRPGLVPLGFDRDDVEGRLTLMETLRPIREITADGCVGREPELSRLHTHLDPGQLGSLYDIPAMLVHGVGGVGKSTLVARFVRDVAEAPDPPAWAYLDLDRPSLASFEPLPLLRDIARQVGAQFPAVRRALDSEALLSTEIAKGSGVESYRQEQWLVLASSIARLLASVSAGRLVVVLDTYEELQRHEARTNGHQGDELYRMFARLSDDLPQFRLVVSGRAPATSFVASGATRVPQEVLPVGPLQSAAAAEALQMLYERELARAGESPPPSRLPPALVEEVLRTVGRSPLTLKLAARVLVREGGDAVQEAAGEAQAAGRDHALERIRAGFVDGFLYHRILRHLRGVGTIEPEVLQRIARASIPLRRITPDVIAEVVLPTAGATWVRTEDVMAALAAEAAFTQAESYGLRLREELRRPALLALRYSDPPLVAEIHRRAAAHYASEPVDAVESAYHLLAGGLPADPRLLTPDVVRQLDDSLEELAPDGRDLVTAVLADPSVIQREIDRRAREREVDAAVARALMSSDLAEADRLLADRTWWTPATTLHASVSLLAERRGDLDAAAGAARADQAAAERAQGSLRYVIAAVRCALLEERLHGGEAGAAVLAAADGQPWLGDQPLLHLELRLNRLAMLERHDLPYDSWLQRLEARALLSRCDPDELRERTSVVRLLAATLGEEEPRLVLNAVRAVGLGTATGSPQVRAVAEALAAWDVAPSPGAVARQVGLRTPGRTLRDVWAEALASPHTDLVATLDSAFAIRGPDALVLSALRQDYLWQGVEHGQAQPLREARSFLDSFPLDFTDESLQRLVRALRGAYPKPEDLQSLATRAGLDLPAINWRQSPGRLVTEVLVEASRSRRLVPLIGEVLTDQAAAAFQPELRDIVEPRWLREQDLVQTYHQLGKLAQDEGDYAEAGRRYRQALSIGELLGDQAEMARGHDSLGGLAQDQGQYAEAQLHYEQTLAIFQEIGSVVGAAATYGRLGVLAHLQGHRDKARNLYRRALDTSEQVGDNAHASAIHHNLGLIARDEGDLSESESRLRRALAINIELGDRAGAADNYHSLGQVALDQDDYTSAERHFQQALTLHEELGDRRGVAAGYNQLGIVAQHQGEYPEAERRYQQALTLSDQLGDRRGVDAASHQLGTVAQALGEYPEAERRYQQALAISEELGDQAGMAITMSQLGLLRAETGNAAEAVALHCRALVIWLRLGDPRAAESVERLHEFRARLGRGVFARAAATVVDDELLQALNDHFANTEQHR